MTIELTKAEQGIQQTIENLTAAWNNRDANMFVQLFTEDADLSSILDESVSRNRLAESQTMHLFESIFSPGNLIQKEVKIRLISQNLASASVTWSIDMEGYKPDDQWNNHVTFMHLMLRRVAGQWLIYIMYSIDLPAVSAN